jgi:hypothetical protein
MLNIFEHFLPKPSFVNQTRGTRPPHQMRERVINDGKAPQPPYEVQYIPCVFHAFFRIFVYYFEFNLVESLLFFYFLTNNQTKDPR